MKINKKKINWAPVGYVLSVSFFVQTRYNFLPHPSRNLSLLRDLNVQLM